MRKILKNVKRIVAIGLVFNMSFYNTNLLESFAKASNKDEIISEKGDTTGNKVDITDISGGKPIHDTTGNTGDNSSALEDAGINVREKDETIEDITEEKKKASDERVRAARAITSITIKSNELVYGDEKLYGNPLDTGKWKVRGNGEHTKKATVAAYNDIRTYNFDNGVCSKTSEGSTRLLFRVYDQTGKELDTSVYTLIVTDRDTGEQLELKDPNIFGTQANPTGNPPDVKAFSEIDDPVRIYFPGVVPSYKEGDFDPSNPQHDWNFDAWWYSFYSWYEDYVPRYNLLDFNRVGNYTVTAKINVKPEITASMDVDAVEVPRGGLVVSGKDPNGYGGGSTDRGWSVPSSGGEIGTEFEIVKIGVTGKAGNYLDKDLTEISVVEYDYSKKTPDNPNFDPTIQSTVYYYTEVYNEAEDKMEVIEYWGDEVDKSVYSLSADQTKITFNKPGLYKINATIGEPSRAGADKPYSLSADVSRSFETTTGLPVSVSKKPTMTLKLNGGNAVDGMVLSQTMKYAQNIKLNSFKTPIKVGSTFDDWYLEPELTNSILEKSWHFFEGTINHMDGSTVVERAVNDWQYGNYYYLLEDETYYAGWILNEYVVEFVDKEFGLVAPSQEVTFEDYVVMPDIHKKGYRVEGWYTEPKFVNEYNFGQKYNIEADVEEVLGAQKVDPNTGELMIMPDYDSDFVIVRDQDGNVVGTPIYEKSYVGNVKLYPKWEETLNYIVTFDVDGGSYVEPQLVESDWASVATRPTDPTKAGYTFDNWYTDKTYTTVYDFSKPVKNDIVIYGKFLSNTKCVVKFDSNGGSAVASQEITKYEKVTKPTTPTKVGNTFVGWFSDVALTEHYDFNSEVTESFTLYAKWRPIPSYTVTFVTNGGSKVNSVNVYQGKTVSEPMPPTKAGYTFGGWYIDRECTKAYKFNMPVNSNLKLYAKWIEDFVPVPDDNNDNDIIKPNDNVKACVTEEIGCYRYRACILTADFRYNTILHNANAKIDLIREVNNESSAIKKTRDEFVKHNKYNETLFDETLFDVSVVVNNNTIESYKKPVLLTYDLSGFDFSNINTDEIISILIDEVTGEVTYLGGRYVEETQVFETTSRSLHGYLALVIPKREDYHQATFVLNNIYYNSNDKIDVLDAAPFVDDGVTFIPLRALFETFADRVDYEVATQTATVYLDGKSVKFITDVSQDGNPAPRMVNHRMFIPVRYASETLGANVIWFSDDENIQVTK